MNEDNLKQKIRETLKCGNHNLNKHEVDNLFEEINIYHRELEYQNEELRRIQFELEVLNLKLNSLFNDAPVGYAICDSELKIISSNRTFKQLLGIVDVANGVKFTNFVHQSSQDSFYLFFKSNSQGKPIKSTEVKLVSQMTSIDAILDLNNYLENGNTYHRITITDISLQKQVEKKLRKSESRFKSLFDKHSAIQLIIDPRNAIIIDANYAALNFYGYSRFQLIGSNISILNRLDKDEIRHKIQKLISEKEFRVSLPHVLIDGSTRMVEIFGNYITNEDGDEFIHVIIHDISSKSEAEHKVKLLSRSVEQNPASVIITNPHGFIEYVNPAFTRITGYSFDEVFGKNPRLLKSNSHGNEFYKKLWDTILGGNDWSGEMLNRKKDGTLYWEETIISPILNDIHEVTHFVATKLDLTKKKLDENLILQREANIKAILENTLDSIWSIDLDYKIQYINDVFSNSFKNTFGLQLNIGTNILNYIPEEISGTWKTLYDKTFSGEHVLYENIINFNGVKVYIEVSMLPIYVDGKVIGASIYGRDITQKKLYELDLIKAKEKAEESDRLKSAFLANMSHEIRTPINGILGFTDLLNEMKVSPETQHSYIGIIQKAGMRLLDTVNDLIDISKIETGQTQVAYSDANIKTIIDNLINFFQPQTTEKGLELINKIEPVYENEIVRTDVMKLNSILTNLIKNAIKYTDKGFVSVDLEIKDGFVEVIIADSGIGIPASRQQAIFNRFEQADISDKRALQGSGLGLSISKAYVEMLGGQIWVESIEGYGSSFHFNLPIQPGNTALTNLTRNIIPPETHGKVGELKILIAEDDELGALFLSMVLKERSSDIIFCKTGVEALEILKENSDVDLILMDLKMPSMNGYEATKQIRQINKEVKIIAQTAYALIGDKEKALESGCDEYIAKPINKGELLRIIDRLFS